MTDTPAVPAPMDRLRGLRLVGSLTLVSRLLGFARDSAMAAAFGLGPILDAFTLAFRIPNLARSLFGEGALTTAFLPIFVAERARGDDAARRLATVVFHRLALILAGLVAAAELGLLALSLSGALNDYWRRPVQLLSIMIPYLWLICMTALLGGMLQAQRRFGWPALVPALLNAWWLAVIGVTHLLKIEPEIRIRIIAGALLLGGAIQFSLPAIALWLTGWKLVAVDDVARERARSVFRAMAPTVAASSVAQLNTVLDSFVAVTLAAPDAAKRFTLHVEPGTAAALFYSQRMYQFPLGLIGVAMATVLYPVLSSHAAAKKFDELRDDLTHGLQVALSVAIPASGGLAVLAVPITRALFQHGKFTAGDAALTSRIMGIYGSAVWAAVGLMLVQRGFFASGDRKTPLKTGLVAVGVNIALIALCVSLAGGTGLAAASAMTAIFHFGLSLLLLRTHVVAVDWTRLGWTVAKTVAATALMVVACLGVEKWFHDVSGRWTLLTMLLGTGAATFLMAAQYLKLKEHWELILPKRNRSTPVSDETVTAVLDGEAADLSIENPR